MCEGVAPPSPRRLVTPASWASGLEANHHLFARTERQLMQGAPYIAKLCGAWQNTRMSFEAGRPTRPVAVMPTFTDALATGTMPGQQQSSTAIQADFQSASTPVKPQQAPATYPEIATFSEINQLFPGATLMARQQQMLRCVETANRGRLEGGDAMVYACRHPAAEQKRSTRINNR